MKRVYLIGAIIFLLLINANLTLASVINVCNSGCDFSSIQGAIINASDGDTINVLAGTYNENQIIINKSLVITGAENYSSIINGNSATLTSTGLVRIIASGNINFSGFKLINAGGTANSGDGNDGKTNVAIYTQSPNNASVYVISNNKIYGTNNADDEEDYGLYSNSGKEYLRFINNTITQTGANEILMELHSGATDISYNTLDAGAYGIDPIFYMTYGSVNISTEQKISFNNINLGTGTGFDGAHRTTGISFMSSYSGSLGEGKYSNIVITDNVLINLNDNRRGISLYNDGLVDGKSGEISSALISRNNISCSIPSNNFGIRLAGYVTNTVISNNNIAGCSQSFVGTDARNALGYYPALIKVNYNHLENQNFIWNNSSILNATNNFWGNCVNPSSLIAGTVSYDPWLGACVQNPAISKTCLMPYDSLALYANVSSKVCFNNVKFYVFYDSIKYIYNGAVSGSGIGNYGYNLNLAQFEGKTIFWNVSAEDCNGYVSNIYGGNFYVNNKTLLIVNKSIPDGLNGWYITEPEFLFYNANASTIRYRWDSDGTFIYSTPFGLENTPNNGTLTGGVLQLNYWSNLCNESEQNKTFYIDLDFPVLKNLVPKEDSIVYNNKRPTISALIDEIYWKTSGIDKTSIVMFVNGIEVNKNVESVGEQDASVAHNPLNDLFEGKNKVTIYAKDNAGKALNYTWNFYINTSVSSSNITINYPFNGIYGKKAVNFNITLNSFVEKLEYKNNNENFPSWRTLCFKCNGFGVLRNSTINLREGENNIIIRARDRFGNIVEDNRTLFIDSISPTTSVMLPGINQYTNGSKFYIKFKEANLESVKLFYGRGTNIKNISNSSCVSGFNECYFDVNLSEFNGVKILYWFEITDVFRKISTKSKEIIIDVNPPVMKVITPVNTTYDAISSKGRLVINMSTNENVKLKYINYNDLVPKTKTLCSNCMKYVGTQTFVNGTNNILITATDKAGNSAEKNVLFEVKR